MYDAARAAQVVRTELERYATVAEDRRRLLRAIRDASETMVGEGVADKMIHPVSVLTESLDQTSAVVLASRPRLPGITLVVWGCF